jgi:hypothetical protein
MKNHGPLTFIFFMLTEGSHELEKDVVKKKIKSMEKLIQNQKIAIKEDGIQFSHESIRTYEDEQKNL